jgi:tryptophan halogenase
MLREEFKFVVVGGGTAGWLSALFLKKYFPDSNITVIESSEIGILGAGEGTTPHFVNFLNNIGISPSDIIYHANGTFKNGIKFTNWNGDGTYYFHGFSEPQEINMRDFKLGMFPYSLQYLENISKEKNMDDDMFSSYVSYNNKVKLSLNQKNLKDPYKEFELQGSIALHFDARLLAEYLKKVGIERGITLIDAKVIKINSFLSGNINNIELDNGTIVNLDFIFDCTGFRRLFIGEHFDGDWKSYSDHLPVNRALPFFLPRTEKEIPPYTEAIAMKYGWIWKIPVGDRYGCGYVFDSNMISDEDAIKEIEELVGHSITSPRTFSFDPGTFMNPWKNNVVAMGLSANFIEPLEATSIWVTIASLQFFLKNFGEYITGDKSSIDRYNESVMNMSEEILAFIYFHYLSERDDTDFWKNFEKNKKPKLYKKLYDRKLTSNFTGTYFNIPSYIQVGAGIKYFDSSVAKKTYDYQLSLFGKNSYHNYLSVYDENLEKLYQKCVDHKFTLDYIKNRYTKF